MLEKRLQGGGGGSACSRARRAGSRQTMNDLHRQHADRPRPAQSFCRADEGHRHGAGQDRRQRGSASDRIRPALSRRQGGVHREPTAYLNIKARSTSSRTRCIDNIYVLDNHHSSLSPAGPGDPRAGGWRRSCPSPVFPGRRQQAGQRSGQQQLRSRASFARRASRRFRSRPARSTDGFRLASDSTRPSRPNT